MNKNILKLQNSVIRIFDSNDSLIGQAIIIEFSLKDDSSRVRPYLVFPSMCVGQNQDGYLLFKMEDGSYHKVTFDTKFIVQNTIDNLVIYPIAGLLNSFLGEQRKVNYCGIPNTLSITDKSAEFINPIEEMLIYSWNINLMENINTTCIYSKKNITPIMGNINNIKTFIFDDGNDILIGSPVFIINNGGYFANNNIYMGSRIIFIGIIEKKLGKYLYVKKSDDLCLLINSKYETHQPINSDNN